MININKFKYNFKYEIKYRLNQLQKTNMNNNNLY